VYRCGREIHTQVRDPGEDVGRTALAGTAPRDLPGVVEPCPYPWTRHFELLWPGPNTLAAINVVAYEHPDAEADCIAAAYDAFDHEHGEAR